MKEKINKILWDFAQSKLTHDEATQQVLDLFAVSGSLQSDMNDIENAMERWHLARDNDDETLEEINRILVSIGRLGFFNRNDR
jgi:hypothetical protein